MSSLLANISELNLNKQKHVSIKIMAEKITSRCIGVTARGTQCKREQWKSRLCYQHLDKQERLRIKKSQIRGANMGLYTTVARKKNEKVADYTGQRLTQAQA